MDRNQEVYNLAIHALRTLAAKVEDIPPTEENYSVLRNIQKTIEAIMETLEPETVKERAYCASDFGWKAGEWPKEATLGTGEKITRVSMNYTIGQCEELESVTYRIDKGEKIEIFND